METLDTAEFFKRGHKSKGHRALTAVLMENNLDGQVEQNDRLDPDKLYYRRQKYKLVFGKDGSEHWVKVK